MASVLIAALLISTQHRWPFGENDVLICTVGVWRDGLDLSALSGCLIHCGPLLNRHCYPHPRRDLDLIRSLKPIKRILGHG